MKTLPLLICTSLLGSVTLAASVQAAPAAQAAASQATSAAADDDDLARLAQREGAGGLAAKLGAKDAATRHAPAGK